MNGATRILSLSGLAALAVGLSACANLERVTAPTDRTVSSPAAAEIARVEAEPTAWPTFSEIPAAPSDIRSSAEWRASIASLTNAGRQVAAAGAESAFALHDSEGFAAGVVAGLDRRAARPVTDAERSESQAFVNAAKARATPPPRPH